VATVRVERTLQAPVDRVFDLLTDHAGYSRFDSIQGSVLLRAGKSERNGVGALRWIYSRPFWFEEEVLAFERPRRMDYVIRRTNGPIRHEGGSIALEENGSGTQVVWTSTLEVTTPVLGRVVDSAAGAALGRGFDSVLDDVQRLA
jgi:uncharacterized protein YndB with AHSA1/START domain